MRKGAIDCVSVNVACVYGVGVGCENIKVGKRECSRGEACAGRTLQRNG